MIRPIDIKGPEYYNFKGEECIAMSVALGCQKKLIENVNQINTVNWTKRAIVGPGHTEIGQAYFLQNKESMLRPNRTFIIDSLGVIHDYT